ncbi:MAG: cytochrome c biogenesis protein CcdA [Candidatus Omnitrophica bacterium]|nr:cytochrome c biogenesis protein CcdA [Candidatus Omnitrophota bacterium]
MDITSLALAFVAGIASFLSPCVLPLVPGYISFLSGVSLDELRKGPEDRSGIIKSSGLISIAFVLGFTLVFISLGASASFLGKVLSKYFIIFTKLAGILIVVFGLHLMGIFELKWLNYQKSLQIKKYKPNFFGALVVGMAFGFGWTPCVGPVLAGILALAATRDTLLEGVFLLTAYSAGIGVPFIITGFAIGIFMKFFEKYKKFIRIGEIFAGVFLVLIGVLIFFNNMDFLLKFIPDRFNGFSR